MRDLISLFCRDDDGAVTVDFVVLTAAICTMGFVVLSLFTEGATDLGNYSRDAMLNTPVE